MDRSEIAKIAILILILVSGYLIFQFVMNPPAEKTATSTSGVHRADAESPKSSPSSSIDQNQSSSDRRLNEVVPSEQESIHIDLISPHSGFNATLYYSIPDVLEVFLQNFEKAESGDGDALATLSHVAQYCWLTEGIENEQDVDNLYASGQLTEEFAIAIKAALPPCQSIAAQLAEENFTGKWYLQSEQWRNEAMENGNGLAALEHAIHPKNRDYLKASVLLEDVVRTGDFRAFYQAELFLGAFQHERIAERNAAFNPVEASTWQYAGCVKDPACDEGVMLKNLELRFVPHELFQIVQAADNIEQRLADPSPFNF